MPKVGKEWLRHNSSRASIEVQVDFLTGDKLFRIKFPPAMSVFTSDVKGMYGNEIYGKTYEDVLLAARKLYYEYCEQSVEESPCLAYDLRVGFDQDPGVPASDWNLKSLVGKGVSLRWKPITKVVVDGKAHYTWASFDQCRYEHGVMRSGGPQLMREDDHRLSDYHIIPYSEEAEVFFKHLEGQLEKLAKSAHEFFGAKGQNLLENIATQKLLKA